MERSILVIMLAGAASLFGFGIVWLLFGLYRGRPSPAWLRVSFLLAGIILCGAIVTLGMHVSKIFNNSDSHSPQQQELKREIGRHFYTILGLEVAAILVAVVVLTAIHYADFILPGIALIVGVHFFPLAALFRTPVYYGTGLMGCAIGLVGFFMSDAVLRQKVVGLLFGLILWTTAAWITWQGLSLVGNLY